MADQRRDDVGGKRRPRLGLDQIVLCSEPASRIDGDLADAGNALRGVADRRFRRGRGEPQQCPPALSFKASAVNSRPSSRIMTREAIFSISGKMCEAISTVWVPASEWIRSRTAMTWCGSSPLVGSSSTSNLRIAE